MMRHYYSVFIIFIVICFSFLAYAQTEESVPGLEPLDAEVYPQLAALEQRAEAGVKEAQYSLGVGYDTGQGLTQNYEKAVHWYMRAAEQGMAEAQYNLGVAHSKGNGVEQNHTEAVKWYTKAGEQGLAKAQYNLGVAYSKGLGVPQNFAEAAKWYRMAAENGMSQAQYNLGVIYETGQGVEHDRQSAYFWLNLSAVSGNTVFSSARDQIARQLTQEQLYRTQEKARNWHAASLN